jgi:hypothetical protein
VYQVAITLVDVVYQSPDVAVDDGFHDRTWDVPGRSTGERSGDSGRLESYQLHWIKIVR